MAEIENNKNINFSNKWGLRVKFNIYIILIIVVTIFIFDISAVRLQGNYIIIHMIHAIVTILLIVGLVNVLFSKMILKPIKTLVMFMKDMEKGKFDKKLELENGSSDEIGWLIDGFIKLQSKLQQLIRLQKKDSASAVAYRTWRELQEPLTNLSMNVKLLRETLDSRKIKDVSDPLYNIVYEIENDYHTIKTFSDQVSSMFFEKSD